MRKLWMAAATGSALLGLVACNPTARDVENRREALAKTESKARADIAQIRHDAEVDKAKRAAEARNDIVAEKRDLAHDLNTREDKAEHDIAQKQKDIAAKREDIAQAESADVQDQVANRDTHRVDNRDLALRNTGRVPAVVTGTLKSTFGKQLTVRDAKGLTYKLITDDATRVTRKGMAVDIDDFKEGAEIRASYLIKGEDRIARDVEVLDALHR